MSTSQTIQTTLLQHAATVPPITINNIPNMASVAAYEIELAFGNSHPSAAQVQNMASHLTVSEAILGMDAALGIISQQTMLHDVIEQTIYGTDTHMAPAPTLEQSQETILIGQVPGGFEHLLFGY